MSSDQQLIDRSLDQSKWSFIKDFHALNFADVSWSFMR
jgi:hypothetical protein